MHILYKIIISLTILILFSQLANAQQEIVIPYKTESTEFKIKNIQNVIFKLSPKNYVTWINLKAYPNFNSDITIKSEYWIINLKFNNYIEYLFYRTFQFNFTINYYNQYGEYKTIYQNGSRWTIFNDIFLEIEIKDNMRYINTTTIETYPTTISYHITNEIATNININDSRFLPIHNLEYYSQNNRNDITILYDSEEHIKKETLIKQLNPVFGIFYRIITLIISDSDNFILNMLYVMQVLISLSITLLIYFVTKPFLILLIIEGFAIFYVSKTSNNTGEAIINLLKFNIELTRKILNLIKGIIDIIIAFIRSIRG